MFTLTTHARVSHARCAAVCDSMDGKRVMSPSH